MDELLRSRSALADTDIDWLHKLVGEWQLLADLSFADLLLFAPTGADAFVCVAQIRPSTGPTGYQDDKVGMVVAAASRPQLALALAEGRVCREGDPVWVEGVPIREEAIPVRHCGRSVAVMSRDSNLAGARSPSRLEIAYLHAANDLAQMIAEGRFPVPGSTPPEEGGPRVGDGFIRLDADGTVSYASPNAMSASRRLGHPGDLVGLDLSAVTGKLVAARPEAREEPVAAFVRGRLARSGDVEGADAVVHLRAIPLRLGQRDIGAIVLVHDVTELRRRERQLMTKDATIREIHHRVKNNLQTVAALLRLQARRLASSEARTALEESVRRVSSIALVHDTLSLTLDEAVPFDEIAAAILAMLADLAAQERVDITVEGTFGTLSAGVATSLAMVLTELVQNAVEHAYGGRAGRVVVAVRRGAGRLRVAVLDEGAGLPARFALADSDRLGLQIVRSLVQGELGGQLLLERRAEGGTAATIDVPVRE